MILRRFFFIAVLFLSTAVRARDGIPSTTMVFPMIYAQNIYLKYILSAYGKSDAEKIQAMQNAELAIKNFAAQPRMIVRVEDLDDLRNYSQLYFPLFDSLQDELQYREAQGPPPFLVLSGAAGDAANALSSMWSMQQSRLKALANLPEILSFEISEVSVNKLITRLFEYGPVINFSRHFIPDSTRLALANLIEHQFKKGITQIDSTGRLIADSGQLKHADPSMERFFAIAIGEYFRNLETVDKLDILSSFINSPDQSSAQEKFEIMVLSAGPQFQKMFQGYARELSDDAKALFKKLESNARAAPFRLIKSAIDAEPVSFKWLSIDPKPLGIGTMAQVHRAKIQLANGEVKEVVVRVLKPHIEKRLDRDNQMLRDLAPTIDKDPMLNQHHFPKITPFAEQIIDMGQKELNVPATVAAQIRGTVYNKSVQISERPNAFHLQFHVPKIYFTNESSKIMVQEFIPGDSFEEFESKRLKIETDPKERQNLARTAMEQLASLWLTETFLESGFYHADLHQGNIRISYPNSKTLQINILDFGMTGQIDRKLQNQIIGLGMIVKSRNARYIARALLELSSKDTQNMGALPTEEKLAQIIQTEVDHQDLTLTRSDSMGVFVNLAANSGLVFPQELTSLNRGLNYLQQMLHNQKSSLDIGDILKSALRRKPSRWREIPTSYASLTKKDWLRILWLNAKNKSSGKTSGESPPSPEEMGLPISCRDVFTPTFGGL